MAGSVLEKCVHDLRMIHIAKIQHSLSFVISAADTMVSHSLFTPLSLRPNMSIQVTHHYHFLISSDTINLVLQFLVKLSFFLVRSALGQDYKEKHKLDSKQISNSPC